jgi:hypothetical protein
MNDLKTIGQNLVELAKDPSDPIGQTIAKCPCVQALLEANTNLAKNTRETWLDNQDVMFMLHISLRSLQTMRSNGTLPYSRINNKIYYRRSDIEKLLNDNYSPKNTRQQSFKKGGNK